MGRECPPAPGWLQHAARARPAAPRQAAPAASYGAVAPAGMALAIALRSAQ